MSARIEQSQVERIERALEEMMAPDELAAFHADVVRDPALRAAYAERAWLHGALHAERERLPELLEPVAEVRTPVRWGWFTGLGMAAAAVGAILVAGWPRATPSGPVAILVEADNTKWAGSTLPTTTQSPLGPGFISLVEGIATVRFESGAVVTLEAPTQLEIVSAMRCRLLKGSITAEVPESAHGFTVDTPEFRIVDLGTRFGVTASSTGSSHVFVFKGSVELNDYSRSVVRRLSAGRAYLSGSGPTMASFEPNRAEPVTFADGWISVPTSVGRGRDSYVRRGGTEPAGYQPLLLVKHSELDASRTNERRAIITFDLAELAKKEIAEAQLILNPEPSGLGFSAMVLDARFAVYGVIQEGADQWSEAKQSWENLPGCNDEGVVAGQVARLAEFALPRGSSGGPLTIQGEALAPFVNAQRGRTVTFLIVRETGETDPTGLVHAFASKEHPTARPPTLRVR